MNKSLLAERLIKALYKSGREKIKAAEERTREVKE